MHINFYATLRPIVGGRSIDIDLAEGTTVRELIAALVTRYPPLRQQLLNAQGELYPHVHIFVNGRDAPYLPNGVETQIYPGDTVDIFPAVAGG